MEEEKRKPDLLGVLTILNTLKSGVRIFNVFEKSLMLNKDDQKHK